LTVLDGLGRKVLRAALPALALSAWLAPGSAQAGPLGLDDCGPTQGTYQCSGLVRTWDGIPLDTTVTLPPNRSRRLPLIVELHGFGNSKWEYLNPADRAYTENAFNWARRGYAVLTYTSRGLWGSCGQPEARVANPADCLDGYIHLADGRYEVRDAQTLIGRLVDERYADPDRIGVTGDSYGGGQSMMLAALRNRVMRLDGRLVPWRSPKGEELRIAAAAPVIPWTDLLSAIAPNGRTFTYSVAPTSVGGKPVGVFKSTFANAIAAAAQFATGPGQPLGEPFVPGRPMGFLAPPGTDPQADVLSWVARADAGEPFDDAEARAIVAMLTRFHSAYAIKPSRRPPPLFLGSGFTDDLFPVDEVVRYVNRTKRLYPRLPVSLFLGDYGHQRAGQKAAQRSRLIEGIRRWFRRYLKGKGRVRKGATAFLQTCPREAPSSRGFFAPSFGRLARGEVRLRSLAAQTVTSDGGNPATGVALDPVGGGGDACATVPEETAPGTATYELPQVTRAYTLLGAPTIRATLDVSGARPDLTQLAGRLWDVGPGGEQILVARGSLRPRQGRNVWQLHPGAWRFASGHSAKLELLGNDAPSSRPSNASFQIDVSRLQLRLPVRQRPNCKQVRFPAPLLLPAGQPLAPGWRLRSRRSCRR
jgi:predicted acyl esterase